LVPVLESGQGIVQTQFPGNPNSLANFDYRTL